MQNSASVTNDIDGCSTEIYCSIEEYGKLKAINTSHN